MDECACRHHKGWQTFQNPMIIDAHSHSTLARLRLLSRSFSMRPSGYTRQHAFIPRRCRSPVPNLDRDGRTRSFTKPPLRLHTSRYVNLPWCFIGKYGSSLLPVSGRSKRIEPAHNIANSHIPYLHILSILRQHLIAFDHRDQKTCSLFRMQVAAD